MRKLLPLLLILATAKGFGQAPSADKQKLMSAKIDSFVTQYMRYSSFLAPGKNTVTSEATENYKSLFAPGAQVPNEMLPAYFYGDTVRPGRIVISSANDYAQSVSSNFANGIGVKLVYSRTVAKDVNSRTAKVLVVKRVEGVTAGGLNLQDQDTIVLNLAISNDFKQVQIKNVEVYGHSFTSSNDRDHDFVPDDKDPCPDTYNVHRWASTGVSNGCPTDWEKAADDAEAELEREFYYEIQLMVDAADSNNEKQKPIKAKIDRLRVLLSTPPRIWAGVGVHTGIIRGRLTNEAGLQNKQSLSTNFKGSAALGGDIRFAYFFGKEADFGIGAGLAYSSFSGKLTDAQYSSTINNSMADVGDLPQRPTEPFTQIISLTQNPNTGVAAPIVEKVRLAQLYMPLTFIYKGDISPSFGYQLEGGLAYSLFYKGTMVSTTNAQFDYEAVYNYANSPRLEPATTNTNPDEAFYITKAFAAGKYGYKTIAQQQAYLNMMHANGAYPVGSGVTPLSTNSSAAFKGSLGVVLRGGISYYLNSECTVGASLYLESGSLNNTYANYQLIDAYNTRRYNTLLNGISGINLTHAGISISLVHSIFNSREKWLAQAKALQMDLQNLVNKYLVIHGEIIEEQKKLNDLKRRRRKN